VLPILFLGLVISSSASANEELLAKTAEQEKVPWRNSMFTYENMFSAYSFSRSADLTYNPYYAQSFSFRPRYYPRDDLSLRLRLDLEVEVTTSDDTDHAREWVLSDLTFDTVYAPKALTIPVVGIRVEPSLRFIFPTSIESRGRSTVMTLGPGVAFKRSIPLMKGKWLKELDLTYGFRFTKYFSKYATAQHAELEGCENLARPECQHRGKQNISWRFVNAFDAALKITDKLSFTWSMMFINNLLHQLPAQDIEIAPGLVEPLGPSAVTHTAATWAIFDLSYDVLDWLSLSIGTSTYYGQLATDSSYRTPIFNRYTNFFFDVTIPVDQFVAQVKSWAGRGKAKN